MYRCMWFGALILLWLLVGASWGRGILISYVFRQYFWIFARLQYWTSDKCSWSWVLLLLCFLLTAWFVFWEDPNVSCPYRKKRNYHIGPIGYSISTVLGWNPNLAYICLIDKAVHEIWHDVEHINILAIVYWAEWGFYWPKWSKIPCSSVWSRTHQLNVQSLRGCYELVFLQVKRLTCEKQSYEKGQMWLSHSGRRKSNWH